MMYYQRGVILLFLVTIFVTLTSTAKITSTPTPTQETITSTSITTTKKLPQDYSIDEIEKDDKISLAFDYKYNKMLPQLTLIPIKFNNKMVKSHLKPTAKTSSSTTSINNEQQKSKIPLADDLRYNKMLPEKTNKKKYDINNNDKSKQDYSEDDYDDDDYYDDEISEENNDKSDISTTEKIQIKKNEIKTTKDNKKPEPKMDEIIKSSSPSPNNSTNNNDSEDSDDDDDDDDDDIEDEEEIIFSENVPCPRDCICARNINSYLVATCSRLDGDVQKFGSDITDLVVTHVGPKYPIVLGSEFFLKIGLKHVSSIKIANSTIEYIDPSAFHGLEELFSVNLTNVGLTTIHPDLFAKNTRLQLLTISGNDFGQISEEDSINSNYLLKSSSVEQLDLSNNNLHKLLPNAFTELKNIAYINLAQNNLKNLPEKLFEPVNTIEELDLSFNSISTLPPYIFNNTSLAVLYLKYNDITGDLRFGTTNIQQLDLSFCSIKHVTNFMFSKMEGLTNLNLKGNGLVKIQPEAFLSLKNLRSIDLSMNDLEQISSLLFYKNSELDIIRLNDNPRLSQLPTDGFRTISSNGFNVYHFDISNCAIGAIGYNTFLTMRQLTTLKLAWNNINNLDKLTFTSLDRLTELDLSNNLIVKLDDGLFKNNRDLTKLNLAGNPIKKLSAKLFLPLKSLRELDVSECELYTLLTDNYYGVDSRFKFYETLHSFNASFNQIKKITKEDIQYFKNLKSFDIFNNPLKCNDDFRNVMKWLIKKDISSGKVPTHLNLQTENIPLTIQTAQTWDELTRNVCKHATENNNFKQTTTTTTKQQQQHNIDIIDTKIVSKDGKIIVNKNNNNNDDDIDEDSSINNDDNDNDNDNDEQNDDNDSDYVDDYDEETDDDDSNDQDNDNTAVVIKDKGLFADEIDLAKETEDKFLRGKLGNTNKNINTDHDDDNDDDDDDDLDISTSAFYYENYSFILQLLLVLSSVMILLILIGKIVSMMMRKRGERYRQAILASKNSIVYQKLCEDLTPTPPTPKIHRYVKIDQLK